MLEDVDEQEEERIALRSIYEGDNAFKEVNEVTFQYKVRHAYTVIQLWSNL